MVCASICRLVPNNRINEFCSREDRELTDTAFDPETRLFGDVQAGKVLFAVMSALPTN